MPPSPRSNASSLSRPPLRHRHRRRGLQRRRQGIPDRSGQQRRAARRPAPCWPKARRRSPAPSCCWCAGSLSNMASRVGQRIVGSVLSRLVSVVAGGVGVVLIAKDIWDFRHGVLPIIATEMKSKASKELVQAELAKAIGDQIGDHTRDISSATAERVLEIWREFRRGHAKVVELAERHDGFRRFLDATRPEHLPRLDEVIALILSGEGEAGILKRLDNGTLQQAVSALPARGHGDRPRNPLARSRPRLGRACRPATAESDRARPSTSAPSRTTSPAPRSTAFWPSATSSPSPAFPASAAPPATSCSSSTTASSRALPAIWPSRSSKPSRAT